MDFLTLSSRILDGALQMGAVVAEVFAKTGSSSDLKMVQGKVESIATAEEEGLGIRFALSDGRWGFAYTVDPSPDNVRLLLEEAFRGTAEIEGCGYPPVLPCQPPGDMPDEKALAIWSEALQRETTGAKIDLLRKIEAAAHGAHPHISYVDTILYHDGWTQIYLRNTEGFQGSYRRTQVHVVLNVLAAHAGKAVLSHHGSASCGINRLDPVRIGQAAARRAALSLGGERLSPRRVMVILEAPVAAQLLESFAPSFLGDTHQKGRSLFQEKLGKQIAAPNVTIIDDARIPGGLSTSPFDGEGTPTGKTTVLEAGVLKHLLYDTATAQKDGVTSTGNAIRRSYRDIPRSGVSNLYIESGPLSTSDLLLDVDAAFRVMNLTRGGGINPVTGQFSVAASGTWCEGGQDRHPVSGVTLSGDLREMLQQVVAVGDDLVWHHGGGSFGSPTLVIEGLTVAG